MTKPWRNVGPNKGPLNRRQGSLHAPRQMPSPNVTLSLNTKELLSRREHGNAHLASGGESARLDGGGPLACGGDTGGVQRRLLWISFITIAAARYCPDFGTWIGESWACILP